MKNGAQKKETKKNKKTKNTEENKARYKRKTQNTRATHVHETHKRTHVHLHPRNRADTHIYICTQRHFLDIHHEHTHNL